jgi:hypothetical protein
VGHTLYLQAEGLPPSSKFLLVVHTALSFGETVWSNFNLKGRNRKTVHHVLELFRDKIVHDVLEPDNWEKQKFS